MIPRVKPEQHAVNKADDSERGDDTTPMSGYESDLSRHSKIQAGILRRESNFAREPCI